MTDRTIDHSRYRVAESIVDRWEAGESAESIGRDFFGATFAEVDFTSMSEWIVELIAAAHDRKGRYEPK